MTPSQGDCEKTLTEKSFRCMAMSVLASGAIPVREALEYVCDLPNVQSIVFGASSKQHIEQTQGMISSIWNLETPMIQRAIAS
jgi:predicted aldo/keto reductase-like oxidoreductase